MTAWLAITALLIAAVVPALSQALPMSGRDAGALQMQICSVYGKVSALPGSSDPADGHGIAACCFCCLAHGDIIGPPQSEAATGACLSIAYPLVAVSYQSASSLFAWTVASSRAPPTFA